MTEAEPTDQQPRREGRPAFQVVIPKGFFGWTDEEQEAYLLRSLPKDVIPEDEPDA